MNQHPYLRAYMAGTMVPTLVLLIILMIFCVARFVFQIPVPIERAIIFPMAIVPNLFGVWNMFYLALRGHRHLPLGLHGAILPFILAPLGFLLAKSLNILQVAPTGFIYFGAVTIGYVHLAIAFLIGVTVYYLVWKYVVGFLNGVLGIAG